MKIRNVANILMLSTTASIASTAFAANAYAIPEVEVNHPISAAQRLAPASAHSIGGAMGVLGQTINDDYDYFTFQAKAGDVLDIDIDNGDGGAGSIDTIVGVFDDTGTLLRMNDNADRMQALDPGSISTRDSLITGFVVPADGTYTVGVSTWPRYFDMTGSVLMMFNFGSGSSPAGDYTLNINGMTPTLTQQVAIEIKPGVKELAPLNPRSKGKVPVAIFGSSDFDVATIDQSSLTFGSTGDEPSLNKCQKVTRDINKDGNADLLCHFSNDKAHFVSGDIEAIVKGQTVSGQLFEGRSLLKVIPTKRK